MGVRVAYLDSEVPELETKVPILLSMLFSIVAAALVARGCGAVNPHAPHGLRVDHTEMDGADAQLALGVSLRPAFSWRLRADRDRRAQAQVAFEVTVTAAGGAGGAVWRSGKVASAVPGVPATPRAKRARCAAQRLSRRGCARA